MEDDNLLTAVTSTDGAADDSDAELDAIIGGVIAEQKAEHSGTALPFKTAEESTSQSTASADTTGTAPVAAQVAESQTGNAPNTDAKDLIRFPEKGKFETDDSYNVRLQIAEMIKKRESAESTSEKDAIQAELRKFRDEFGHLITNNRSQSSIRDDAPADVQPQKGNQTAIEDIDSVIEKKLMERQIWMDNKSAIDTFFDSTPELQDPVTRQVFIDFFDANYKIEGKSPKEVTQTLNLAKQAVFRPAETVQERVLKGAEVQDKVNAMQFPGGTIVKTGLTPDQQQSIDEMVATGMSEDRARALILD